MSKNSEKCETARRYLMAHAADSFSAWAGRPDGAVRLSLPAGSTKWLERYRALLGAGQQPEPGAPLLSIFSRVRDPESKDEPEARYWPPQALSLEAVPVPVPEAVAREMGTAPAALWDGFAREAEQVLKLPTGQGNPRFEAYTHLLHKWAWTVPCSYGEPGVSLYDEFRALSALVHASGCKAEPEKEFLLVGGDIPGIQDFVYTITSKGAAKGLRGRSFFVQLLGDAVVRRLLADLELPEANVVYAAGGNFMLLAPRPDAVVNDKLVADRLKQIRKDAENGLLDALEGDLALSLAWVKLEAQQVANHAFAVPVSRDLKQAISQGKRQPFQAIAGQRWKDLFGPRGKPGNRFCVICQRPLGRDEGIVMEGEEQLPLDQRSRRCSPCDGFKKLAERMGQGGMLAIGQQRAELRGEPWQETLWKVARVWFEYAPQETLHPPYDSTWYSVNDPESVPASASGFRLIANVTPRVTAKDLDQWRQETEKETEPPALGGIRTFGQMANAARGVKRLGVLRMDVDNLGLIMVRGLEKRSMASTSALSLALDRFFVGWLNEICAEVNLLHRATENDRDRGDRLYVIYAGGDDLFVVGSWDLMPELASRVQKQFKLYTGCNSALHLSAGLTLEGRKFPLYQAARRAGRAEDQAKDHSRYGVKKDAISFLGLPVKWDEWLEEVIPRFKTVEGLVSSQRAPRGLIQVIRNIYTQYDNTVEESNLALRQAGRPLPEEPWQDLYYGPWMWHEAYALTRMAERLHRDGDDKGAEKVLGLQVSGVSPISIRYVALAARWAELQTREERDS